MALVSAVVALLIVGGTLVSLWNSPNPLEGRSGLQPLNATLKPGEANAILKPGLEAIERSIRMRDDFLKRGFDFQNAAHIPELQEEIKYLAEYFRKAASEPEHLSRKDNLEKVLKQMDEVFAKKAMSLKKWIWFHLQLAELFSDYDHVNPGFSNLRSANLQEFGKLDFEKLETDPGIDPRPFLTRHTSFPCFVYVHDGVLGLQALNLALVSDILVLGVPTDKTVKADGQDFNPFVFMLHDAQHFAQYSRSAYVFTRFRSGLIRLYHQIEEQTEAVERINDHLALFMFTHEMLPRSSRYPESLERLLQESSTIAQRELKLEYSSIVYYDLDGIFRVILKAGNYVESNMANNMRIVSDRFIAKYAPLPSRSESDAKIRPASDATLESILQAGRPQIEQAKAMLSKLEAAGANIWKTPIPELATRLPALAEFYRLSAAGKPKKEIAQGEKFLSGLGKRISKQPLTMSEWTRINLNLNDFLDLPMNFLSHSFYSFLGNETYYREFPFFVYSPPEVLGIPAMNDARAHAIWPSVLSPSQSPKNSMIGNYAFDSYDHDKAWTARVLSLFNKIEAEKNLRSRALDHLILYLGTKNSHTNDLNTTFGRLADTIHQKIFSVLVKSDNAAQSIYDLLGPGDVQIEQLTANTYIAINLQDPAHSKVSTVTVLDVTPFFRTLKITDDVSTREVAVPRFQQDGYGQLMDESAAVLFEALGYNVASEDSADALVRLIEAFVAKYKLSEEAHSQVDAH